MLPIALIRQDPGKVKERLAFRNFPGTDIVDIVLQLDEERKKLQLSFDTTQAKVNQASKEIGKLMAQGNKEAAEAMKKEVGGFRDGLTPISEQLRQTEQRLEDELLKLPNLPSELVPAGKSAEDNIVVKEVGEKPQLPANAVPHWDLIKEYDLVDFETGARLAGSGFALYKGRGARLQRAMIQYFLDYNTNAGYTEYMPPLLVNAATAYGTGQLPDKEGQMYYMPDDQLYLIPTAEVPVTNIYRDAILKEEELPVKMTAYTPCFRREAGSFGKDVRGLNRVHQFDKVEIVQLVHPDKSYQTLDAMVAHVEELLKSLELPFRILRLCGGDMGFTSALTYDFEVYSAAQARWLEVSSVSNFENYQTNRMKIRYKDGNGKNQLLHSLNGSSMALPRVLAAMLENNQEEGRIRIPKVLESYFGSGEIVK